MGLWFRNNIVVAVVISVFIIRSNAIATTVDVTNKELLNNSEPKNTEAELDVVKIHLQSNTNPDLEPNNLGKENEKPFDFASFGLRDNLPLIRDYLGYNHDSAFAQLGDKPQSIVKNEQNDFFKGFYAYALHIPFKELFVKFHITDDDLSTLEFTPNVPSLLMDETYLAYSLRIKTRYWDKIWSVNAQYLAFTHAQQIVVLSNRYLTNVFKTSGNAVLQSADITQNGRLIGCGSVDSSCIAIHLFEHLLVTLTRIHSRAIVYNFLLSVWDLWGSDPRLIGTQYFHKPFILSAKMSIGNSGVLELRFKNVLQLSSIEKFDLQPTFDNNGKISQIDITRLPNIPSIAELSFIQFVPKFPFQSDNHIWIGDGTIDDGDISFVDGIVSMDETDPQTLESLSRMRSVYPIADDTPCFHTFSAALNIADRHKDECVENIRSHLSNTIFAIDLNRAYLLYPFNGVYFKSTVNGDVFGFDCVGGDPNNIKGPIKVSRNDFDRLREWKWIIHPRNTDAQQHFQSNSELESTQHFRSLFWDALSHRPTVTAPEPVSSVRERTCSLLKRLFSCIDCS